MCSSEIHFDRTSITKGAQLVFILSACLCSNRGSTIKHETEHPPAKSGIKIVSWTAQLGFSL